MGDAALMEAGALLDAVVDKPQTLWRIVSGKLRLEHVLAAVQMQRLPVDKPPVVQRYTQA